MTIEEYDAKAEIRNSLDEIDKCLRMMAVKDNDVQRVGIGVNCYFLGAGPIMYYVTDNVFAERFKQLLLERKQELLDEPINFCMEVGRDTSL